jgi:predicted 2-oxoglutarate/Fe(II)-dependent dioxygenase YbiX
VLRYWPGVGHDWHADGSWVHEQSRGRTVSFSLLLNEPGRDFAGGEFETEFGPIDLHAGDAVAFTAATMHRVLPVTAGYRLVLVCFAFATDRRDP